MHSSGIYKMKSVVVNLAVQDSLDEGGAVMQFGAGTYEFTSRHAIVSHTMVFSLKGHSVYG